MDERWNAVLEELKARFPADADVGEVEAYLALEGYDGGAIGEILELLFGDTVSELPAAAPASASVPASHGFPLRVQGPHERGRFSAEAWGYLLTLGSSGLVSQHDFEQLVERALLHVEGRVGIAEIRAIADDGGFDDAVILSDRSLVH